MSDFGLGKLDATDKWLAKNAKKKKKHKKQFNEPKDWRKVFLDKPYNKTLYANYLKSKSWFKKRAIIKSRCKNTCEECHVARMNEVHHLTYEHIGDERLYELVGLCEACHKKKHPEKKKTNFLSRVFV
jgi:16S rRNA G966 N2-methylase RsmD